MSQVKGIVFVDAPYRVSRRTRKQHVHETLLHQVNECNFEADSYIYIYIYIHIYIYTYTHTTYSINMIH